MRSLIYVLVGLVLLMIAGLLLLPVFISTDDLRELLVRKSTDILGREVEVAGLDIALFPSFSVIAEDVRLGNAPGFQDPYALTAKSVQLNIATWDFLFEDRLKIEALTIKQPAIYFEKDPSGSHNWQFNINKPNSSASSAPGHSFALISEAHAAPPPEPLARIPHPLAKEKTMQVVMAKDLTVEQGSLSLRTVGEQGAIFLEPVNLALRPAGEGLALDLQTRWRDNPFSLKGKVGSLQAVLDKQPVAVSLVAEQEAAKVEMDGQVDLAGGVFYTGPLKLNFPNLPGLVNRLSLPAPDMLQKHKAFSLSAETRILAEEARFTNMALTLDDLNVTGTIAALNKKGAKRPKIEGDLSIPLLILDQFMPPSEQKKEEASSLLEFQPIASAHAAADSGPTPTAASAPLSLEGLKAVDLDLGLVIGELRHKEVKATNIRTHTRINDGRLAADIQEMALYEGKATAALTAAQSGKTPEIKAKFSLASVALSPLFKALELYERVEGKANVKADLSMSGAAAEEWKRSLSGTGSLAMNKGNIRGIDLHGWIEKVRNIKNIVESSLKDGGALLPQPQEGERTLFESLAGDFTIRNGTATTQNMTMDSPPLRVVTKGDLFIPEETLNLTLHPARIKMSESGEENRKAYPVIQVKGPWSRPTLYVKPQEELKERAKEEIQKLLNDPAKAGEKLDKVKDKFKGFLDKI